MIDNLFAAYGNKVCYAPAAFMLAVLIVCIVACVSVNAAIAVGVVLTGWMLMAGLTFVAASRIKA
jgi:hypothetical protein